MSTSFPCLVIYLDVSDLLSLCRNDVDTLLSQTNRNEDPFAFFNKSRRKQLQAAASVGRHPVFSRIDQGQDVLQFSHDHDRNWPVSVLHQSGSDEPEQTLSHAAEKSSLQLDSANQDKVSQLRKAKMQAYQQEGSTVEIMRLPSAASSISRTESKPQRERLPEVKVTLAASVQDLAHLMKKIKKFEDAGSTQGRHTCTICIRVRC